MNRKSLLWLVAMVLVAGLVCACDEEAETLEIEGSYTDDSAAVYEIGEEIWTISYVGDADVSAFSVTSYDNDLGYAITQNDSENTWNGGFWSRFDWVFEADDLYLCQIAYDAETEIAAMEMDPADASDLETGCGGYRWSLLTPAG